MKLTDFVARERIGSIQACEDMIATVRACYRAALKYDGMPPDTTFAVFSEGNPFVSFYETAVRQYQEMATACASHGYCGLSMENRDVYKRA